jgi:hypothetical protein
VSKGSNCEGTKIAKKTEEKLRVLGVFTAKSVINGDDFNSEKISAHER